VSELLHYLCNGAEVGIKRQTLQRNILNNARTPRERRVRHISVYGITEKVQLSPTLSPKSTTTLL